MKDKMKEKILLNAFRVLFTVNGFEIIGYSMYLFSHFVNDINPHTAQRDFAIAFGLLWMSSFVTDPLIGLFVDRTGRALQLLSILCFVKGISMWVYTFSTSTTLTFIALLFSFCKALMPPAYAEIKNIVKPEDIVSKISELLCFYALGDILCSILRVVKKDFIFQISILTVTSNTLPSFIAGIIYLMLSVCFGIVYFRSNSKSRKVFVESKSNIKPRKMKILVILSTTAISRLALVTVLVALQEYGEKSKASHLFLGTMYTLQNVVAFIANRVQKTLLEKYNNRIILGIWQVLRVVYTALLFVTSLNLNSNYFKEVLLIIAVLLSSIPYFNDDAVLLPELWKEISNVSLAASVHGLFIIIGNALPFLYPLCENFIELYYGAVMLGVVLNFLSLFYTGLV